MPPIAYFGIESTGLTLVIDLLIVFLVVLYGSLVYWTYADARRRIEDPMLIGCATAASLFPFVGTLIYMILRPPEYLEDARERELDMQAAEARLHELDHSLCPHCDYPIERDFVRCPSCLRKLKERCISCSRPLDRSWTICPYCEAQVPAAAPARRGGRRGERSPAAGATPVSRGALEDELPPKAATSIRAPEPATRAPARSARRAEPAAIDGQPAAMAPERAGRGAEQAARARRGEGVVQSALAPEDDQIASEPLAQRGSRSRSRGAPPRPAS